MSISPRTAGCGPLPAFVRTVFLLAPLAAAAGCANPGPPKPPSLYLPAPAKDLRADRVGAVVHLAWTTSAETTDGVPVKPPLSAEICRDPTPLPSGSPPCTVVGHLPVHPGPSTADDPLPAQLLLDPARPLHYRVRLLNASNHAADPSNLAFAAAGAAPAPIAGLHSTSSPAGTRILWSPVNTPAAAVLLERSTLSSSRQPAPAHLPSANLALTSSGSSKVPKPLRLQATQQGPDPGGTLDPSSQRDTTYNYIAWRSRSVTLDGHDMILRSPDSPPLTVTVRDQTPPAPPIGLQAVSDGDAVDLSWEPSTEADLAGYWVERTVASDGPAASSLPAWQRLNPAPLPAPSFRDIPPPSEPRYLYRVLAVDSTGNLSAPSTPAIVHLSAASHP